MVSDVPRRSISSDEEAVPLKPPARPESEHLSELETESKSSSRSEHRYENGKIAREKESSSLASFASSALASVSAFASDALASGAPASPPTSSISSKKKRWVQLILALCAAVMFLFGISSRLVDLIPEETTTAKHVNDTRLIHNMNTTTTARVQPEHTSTPATATATIAPPGDATEEQKPNPSTTTPSSSNKTTESKTTEENSSTSSSNDAVKEQVAPTTSSSKPETEELAELAAATPIETKQPTMQHNQTTTTTAKVNANAKQPKEDPAAEYFYRHQLDRIGELINEDTILYWTFPWTHFYKHFENIVDIDFSKNDSDIRQQLLKVPADHYYYRVRNDLCSFIHMMERYRADQNYTKHPKPHVLFARLNMDMGALKDHKAHSKGKSRRYYCNLNMIQKYIDHPDTLALVTSQGVDRDYGPKVISLPIGVKGKNYSHESKQGNFVYGAVLK